MTISASSSLPNPFFDDMQPSRGVAFDSFMDRPHQQQQAAMFYMQQQQQQKQQLLQQQHYQQPQDSLAILPATTMTQFSTGELCVKNTTTKTTTVQFLRFVLCSCTKLMPSSLDSFCCACSAANTLLPFTHIYTNMNRLIRTRWSRFCDPNCALYKTFMSFYTWQLTTL